MESKVPAWPGSGEDTSWLAAATCSLDSHMAERKSSSLLCPPYTDINVICKGSTV